MPAKLGSRSDLSKTRTEKELQDLFDDKSICWGSKGFFWTPLPLLPDIRKSEVSGGTVGKLLEAFGIVKGFDRRVTLYQGPNKRKNRYLVYQYKRLIKSIDGELVKGTIDIPGHVVWSHNFYKLTDPNFLVDTKAAENIELVDGKATFDDKVVWKSLADHIKEKENSRKLVWKPLREVLNINTNVMTIDYDKSKYEKKRERFRKLNCAEKKMFKKKARLYWGIANQLIRSSIVFRTAVFKKSLGKSGRWFHRDYDYEDLWDFNEMYQKIADTFSSKMEVRRTWINQEQRDGSYKVRPLGIAPIPWRIYTRGVNNLLEVFISGGWPNNQHGYKGVILIPYGDKGCSYCMKSNLAFYY